ncbi:hypothetical protein NMG60_11004418 [Bertholletia excelsa]
MDARTIVGVVGNIISFFLFLSPIPTFYRIWRAKSVQEFKADPYVATVLNCALWVFYGLPFVHPDSTLVVTINGIGLVIELIYLAIFFIYSNWPKRRKILIVLLVEIIFLAVVVVLTMTLLHTTKKRSMLVGILCIILNIMMYVSPLTVMRRVISTKSVKFMPFYLSLANLANGCIWLVYALLKFDPYILIPNGLGAISGVAQLILYATYYRTTNWDNTSAQHQTQSQSSEVQLPNKEPV